MYAYPTNVTNMTGMLLYTNSVTNGYWGLLTLVVVFFVAFISLKVYTAPRALGGACFITLISTILFRILGLVNNTVLVVVVLLNAVAAAWLWISESSGT